VIDGIFGREECAIGGDRSVGVEWECCASRKRWQRLCYRRRGWRRRVGHHLVVGVGM